MSNRFYVDGFLGLGLVDLDGPEAHHLAHVRRFAAGETVVLFNGDGHEYPAEIVAVGKKRVQLQVLRQESPVRELLVQVNVAAAMPKADRTDFLIEKLTELGATSFTPLHTERSIVKVDADKVEKFRRAVIEASKQCGRNTLMTIHPPAWWRDWHTQPTGQRWLAHTSDAEPMTPNLPNEPVWVAIGPEGGFTPDEIAQASRTGWRVGSLGARILRIETAALAAVVALGLRAV